jgi:hypothetical protein
VDNLDPKSPYYNSTVPKGGMAEGFEGGPTLADLTLIDLPHRPMFEDFPHDIEWTAWTFVVCISKCATADRDAWAAIVRVGLVLMQGIKWGFKMKANNGSYSPPELIEAECAKTGDGGPTNKDIVDSINFEEKPMRASDQNGIIRIRRPKR